MTNTLRHCRDTSTDNIVSVFPVPVGMTIVATSLDTPMTVNHVKGTDLRRTEANHVFLRVFSDERESLIT